jgi:2-polyprenyl-3-methyl-5-hydroxy-6-metoxy-1,4-benzoquinol methylase
MAEVDPFVRRPIVEQVTKGDFAASNLMHMIHYQVSAEHMIKESKRLERPIDVLSIGCGDIWDLIVLTRGMKVSKPSVLRSYTGIDAKEVASPFGKKLSAAIEFKCIVKDLEVFPSLPIGDDSIDLVINTEFIEHVSYDSAMEILAELNCVMRMGGMMYITTPNADQSGKKNDKYHLYEYGREELVGLLKEFGFEVVELYGTSIDKRGAYKANVLYERLPEEFLDMVFTRFPSNWARTFISCAFPEFSTGMALVVRKVEELEDEE